MRKTCKKIVSVALTLCLLCAGIPFCAQAADSSVGANVFRRFDADTQSTIFYGNGPTFDFEPDGVSETFDRVVIEAGVTYVGAYLFSEDTIGELVLPDAAITISQNAFSGCAIERITFPQTAADVTQYDFGDEFSDFGNASVYDLDLGGLDGFPNGFRFCSGDNYTLRSLVVGAATTAIPDNACNCFGSLQSLTLPDGLTEIGAGAFESCELLQAVRIPNSVTTIGDYAFDYCTGLESVTLPKQLLTIGGWAFCSVNLTEVTIPNGATSIGESAFEDCANLAAVTIPNSVTDIGANAFAGTALQNVHLPAGLQNIDASSFGDSLSYVCCNTEDCPAVKQFALEAGVEFRLCEHGSANTISGECGAEGDNVLWTLDPDTCEMRITGVGDMADYDNEDNAAPWADYSDMIGYVTIGSGVTSIGDFAFYLCASLTGAAIGEDVTRIGVCAFAFASLGYVFIPRAVEQIGDLALLCLTLSGNGDLVPTLQSVEVDPDNEAYCAEDGVLYDKAQTALIQYPIGNARASFTVPNGVTYIGESAFLASFGLEDLTISDSVTEIGENAFDSCIFLENVTFGSGLEHIDDEAFLSCVSLSDVTIPDSVTEIGERAFSECESLETLTIGEGVETVGDEAFSACTALAHVTFNAVDCSYMDNQSGAVFDEGAILQTVVIGDAVTTIPAHAFYGLAFLTEITIPESVTTIGDGAFAACKSLEQATFNAVDCTVMGSSIAPVFSVCTALQTVVIGDAVTQIPPYAFFGLDALTAVAIPDSVTAIGDNAFMNCSSLADVTLASGLAAIGEGAFRSCTALANLHIPSSVTAIGDDAFDYCSALEYICSDTAGYVKTYAEANGIEFRLCGGGNVVSGECGAEGDNAVWELDLDTGAMTISGTGLMCDYNYSDTPWKEYAASVRSVVIGGVTNVGYSAFYGCKALESVTILDGVTYIGDHAFQECSALTIVTFSDSVTSIAHAAFMNCGSLADVTFGSGLVSIGESAFLNCTSLTSVALDGVAEIHYAAFGLCKSLETLTLGEGVGYIGDLAFMCTALSNVSIPRSVEEIGDGAFSCAIIPGDASTVVPTMQSIVVDPDNAFFSSQDGVLYNKEKTALLTYPCAAANETFAIPDTVTVIKPYAFVFSANLRHVAIPDGVAEIDVRAFSNCTNLESAHIPSSVTSIGSHAFDECTNLAFLCSDTANGCARTYAKENNIPFRLCTGHAGSAETICGECGAEGDNVLWALNLGSGEMILSGTGAMADYAAAADAPWADYRASIQNVTVRNGVTTIGDNTFCDCAPLTNVTIGEDVTRIGCAAFARSALSDVYIPRSVQEIGESAFVCCTSFDGVVPTLQTIYLEPENESFSLKDGVLYDKSQSTLLVYPGADPRVTFCVPDSVTAIADAAFSAAVNLTSVHVPSSVTAIAADAFDLCEGLEYLCCDVERGCVKTFAADHGIAFRLCVGHEGLIRTAGDANGDGILDLKDVVLVRRYLAGGWDVTILPACADVDGDGSVTLQDVTILTRFLAGGWDVVLV